MKTSERVQVRKRERSTRERERSTRERERERKRKGWISLFLEVKQKTTRAIICVGRQKRK